MQFKLLVLSRGLGNWAPDSPPPLATPLATPVNGWGTPQMYELYGHRLCIVYDLTVALINSSYMWSTDWERFPLRAIRLSPYGRYASSRSVRTPTMT